MKKITVQTSGKFIDFIIKKSKLKFFEKVFLTNKIDGNMQ